MGIDTPLHKNAHNGDLESCREIIESGEVDVNAAGAAERTALMRAAGGNHVDLAKLLLELGAAIDQKDKAGRTALLWCAVGGHAEVIKVCIDAGADINVQTKGGMTALHAIAEANRLDCANVLIGHHEKVAAGEAQGAQLNFDIKDEDGKTPFDIAKEKKHAEIAKMCKEKRLLKEGESAGGCLIM